MPCRLAAASGTQQVDQQQVISRAYAFPASQLAGQPRRLFLIDTKPQAYRCVGGGEGRARGTLVFIILFVCYHRSLISVYKSKVFGFG